MRALSAKGGGAQISRASARTAPRAAATLVSLFILSSALGAQGGTSPKPVRTLIGDVAFILRTDRPGTLRIGVAGESRSLSLSVRATDARRWADSASKLLTPAPRRRATRKARAVADTSVRRRAVLEEPGVGAGTFVLLRIDSASTRHFLLFVDDATLQGIRQPLEPEEAKLLVRLIRGATAPPASAKPRKKGSPSRTQGRSAPPKRTAARGGGANPHHPSTETSSSSLPAGSLGSPVQGR